MKKIFYVEDNEIDRLALKRYINKNDLPYECKCCSTIARAKEILGNENFDLLIIDYLLKKGNAFEILKLKSLPPTIILTGVEETKIAIKAMEMGAEDYLIKDADYKYLDFLLSRIENICSRDKVQHPNSEQQQELQVENEKIVKLHKTAIDLINCKTKRDIYDLTITSAELILNLPICTLNIVKDDKFVVKAVSSQSKSELNDSYEIEGGVCEKSFKRQKTYFGDIDKYSLEKLGNPNFKSVIFSPIGKFGVFLAVSFQKNAYSFQDVKILELLLSHTTEALKRIELEDKLRAQAIKDELTGLYNRRYLNNIIKMRVEQAKRNKNNMAFIYLDINYFKKINDTKGHNIGDEVLKAVAGVLSKSIRQADTIVRLGGDEFFIVQSKASKDGVQIKKRIEENMQQWNEETALDLDFPVTLAIGYLFQKAAEITNLEQILKQTDKLMYKNKEKKKQIIKSKNKQS